MGLFLKIKSSLKKTRENFTKQLNSAFKSDEKINENFYNELEEILILADLGIETTTDILISLKNQIKEKKIKLKEEAKQELKEIIEKILRSEADLKIETKPTIVLIVGVNGAGKTTSIAKLANLFKSENKTVLLGAADTFRAAAIDQLEIWAKRVGCQIVKHTEGSDSAAVVFDSLVAAKKRGIDVVICDTAGRLHNKQNLMKEIEKINKVIRNEAPNSKIEILLAMDASTGQNGIAQAKKFKEAVDLTGIILTKLDGTAKGGIVISIKKQLNLPVKFIGTGEQLCDIQKFDSKIFTDALFSDEL